MIAILSLLLLAGCTEETPPTTDTSLAPRPTTTTSAPSAEPPFPFEEHVITFVDYTPGAVLEIMRPQSPQPAPCVVILHGHTVETTFYHALAKNIADSGAVVFIPDWDDTLPSDADPRTASVTDGLDDIADAIRFIRLYGHRYGADPERIVIVGHSLGAVAGMTIMLAGDRFGTEAFPQEVSAVPDAYVSLDGVVPFRELLWNDDLRRLYDADPATWDKVNPDTYLAGTDLRKGVVFRFFVATLDVKQTQSLAERLNGLGYNATVEEIEVDHMEAAEPQPRTIEVVMELACPT